MSDQWSKVNIGIDDDLEFICLGGGKEVGRSCHILKYKGKVIMLDAGVHPAFNGLAALPFYDSFDLSTVDVLLISHFHLDHAASLPYVMQHTFFKGKVFMTHPTKAIYRWLLSDFVKVSSLSSTLNSTDFSNSAQIIYTDEDLSTSFDKIEAIDFHSTIEVNGIKFTAYHAGHVLGAAMYLIEIGGIKILFTGDYSREEDRHLNPAEIPIEKPDILICESTFGTNIHIPREEKELRLMSVITNTILNGGRCLLPVFSLGRAQELLLVLDEYWENNKHLNNIPIYYASNLAKKCLAVYQTYINMMNSNIRKKFRDDNTNPFQFKHITNLRSLELFDDIGPCVMVASPGMLQNGTSRELLERWAPDARNALIITGYSVEGTLARQILKDPIEIPAMRSVTSVLTSGSDNPTSSAIKIPRRCSVEEISFAAHVDFKQNSEFIDKIGAKSLILVHGEQYNMGKLKSALLSKYSHLKDSKDEIKIYNPRNCDLLKIKVQGVNTAKMVGSMLTISPPIPGKLFSGVVVQKDFQIQIVAPDDLREFTDISSSVILQRQYITVTSGRDLIRFHLEQLFGNVQLLTSKQLQKNNIDDINDKINLEDKINHEGKNKVVDNDFNDINVDFKMNNDVNIKTEDMKINEKDDLKDTKINKLEETETNDDKVEGKYLDKNEEIIGYRVMDAVSIICNGWGDANPGKLADSLLKIEWLGNVFNDSIADAVLAILLVVDSSPASVKLSSHTHSHTHSDVSDVTIDLKESDVKIETTELNNEIESDKNADKSESIEKESSKIVDTFDSIETVSKPDSTDIGSSINISSEKEIDNVKEVELKGKVESIDAFSSKVLSRKDRINRIMEFIYAQFGKNFRIIYENSNEEKKEMTDNITGLELKVSGAIAVINFDTLNVDCSNAALSGRVKHVLERAVETVALLS